jgi:hypothetical protein
MTRWVGHYPCRGGSDRGGPHTFNVYKSVTSRRIATHRRIMRDDMTIFMSRMVIRQSSTSQVEIGAQG